MSPSLLSLSFLAEERYIPQIFREMKNPNLESAKFFRTLVADPPWPETNGGQMFVPTPDRQGKESIWDYPLMTYSEIKDLGVSVMEMMRPKSHCYLWVTQRSLEQGFSVMRAWGFEYKATLTWVKQMGLGFRYFRHSTEFCLFGVRGVLPTRRKDVCTHFEGKRGAHSVKPDTFFDLVTSNSPGPYVEMFARNHRPGWTVWGNEVDTPVPIPVVKREYTLDRVANRMVDSVPQSEPPGSSEKGTE